MQEMAEMGQNITSYGPPGKNLAIGRLQKASFNNKSLSSIYFLVGIAPSKTSFQTDFVCEGHILLARPKI